MSSRKYSYSLQIILILNLYQIRKKMKKTYITPKFISTVLVSFLLLNFFQLTAQTKTSEVQFKLSVPTPEKQNYFVEMTIDAWQGDSLILKMPKWMPGYYQIMNYADDVQSVSATTADGSKLKVEKLNSNTWYVPAKSGEVNVSYEILTKRKFVAQSFVDEEHGYIAPCNTWLYIDGQLDRPASVTVSLPSSWSDVATGLEPVPGTTNKFTSPDFDFLFDCPILLGNLEELPSFEVRGVPHRFIGYKVGDFDKVAFIAKLQKSVEAAVDLMGDIPYKHYTFLAIGPGRGGIEHLNSTTISFDGNTLKGKENISSTLSFITHEYFHHYNVKRIRPVELGPFDYDRANKTTQLWVSEGLSVYYEYRVLKLAGLIDKDQLLQFYSGDITDLENDPGKAYQSLTESSFRTWDEGPFGVTDGEDRSISYYVKGPVVGVLLDFAIREASENQHSLDDVMRFLYNKYYKELGRGFTDAEVQQACEAFAGAPLDEVFEYITTTKPLDYEKYLGFAGLQLQKETEDKDGKTVTEYKLAEKPTATPEQKAMLASWLNE